MTQLNQSELSRPQRRMIINPPGKKRIWKLKPHAALSRNNGFLNFVFSQRNMMFSLAAFFSTFVLTVCTTHFHGSTHRRLGDNKTNKDWEKVECYELGRFDTRVELKFYKPQIVHLPAIQYLRLQKRGDKYFLLICDRGWGFFCFKYKVARSMELGSKIMTAKLGEIQTQEAPRQLWVTIRDTSRSPKIRIFSSGQMRIVP